MVFRLLMEDRFSLIINFVIFEFFKIIGKIAIEMWEIFCYYSNYFVDLLDYLYYNDSSWHSIYLPNSNF